MEAVTFTALPKIAFEYRAANFITESETEFQFISRSGIKLWEMLNFSRRSSSHTPAFSINAGSFSASETTVIETSGIITQKTSAIIPSARRYVSTRQSGRCIFLTNPRLLFAIKANGFFSSADRRTLSTKAMHSAVITG